MTSEDLQDLREMQADLIAAERSRWEPRCVAGAFHVRQTPEPFVLTMQAWIDLDAVESPFLLGAFPEAESALAQFEEAFLAFGHRATTPAKCDPDELILLGRNMIAAIARGFSMRLKLAPPDGFKPAKCGNGLGDWLPVLACLKTQLGFGLAEALALPVEQVFALIAAHRCNQGWTVAGETYAERDVPEDEG